MTKTNSIFITTQKKVCADKQDQKMTKCIFCEKQGIHTIVLQLKPNGNPFVVLCKYHHNMDIRYDEEQKYQAWRKNGLID